MSIAGGWWVVGRWVVGVGGGGVNTFVPTRRERERENEK